MVVERIFAKIVKNKQNSAKKAMQYVILYVDNFCIKPQFYGDFFLFLYSNNVDKFTN